MGSYNRSTLCKILMVLNGSALCHSFLTLIVTNSKHFLTKPNLVQSQANKIQDTRYFIVLLCLQEYSYKTIHAKSIQNIVYISIRYKHSNYKLYKHTPAINFFLADMQLTYASLCTMCVLQFKDYTTGIGSTHISYHAMVHTQISVQHL